MKTFLTCLKFLHMLLTLKSNQQEKLLLINGSFTTLVF
jgi:hypothetical protein